MARVRMLVAAAVTVLLAGTTAEALADPTPTAPPTRPASSSADPGTPTTGATTAPASSAPASSAPADPDVLILHTDTSAGTRSAALRGELRRLGATVRHTFGSQQAVSVQLPAGTRVRRDAAARLGALPGVRGVERPVTRTFDRAPDVPDDPKLAAQRAYLDAVNAPAAWARQHGTAAVRIAVIDSGVDVGHPDLAGKVVGRFNAVTGSSSVGDAVGHGTFVAGVAAADTGNGIGVAGAGYDTSLLAVKIADRYGDIALDDEVAGIRWAVAHGADVINLSISGPAASTAERKAIEYAQRKGVLVVAAAGNEHSTTKQYPAAYRDVIAVGATDVASRRRASFSSHGAWVTLAAPGTGIYSTVPRAGSEDFPTHAGYARGDGTSFATPLVAGAAALVKAQNPAMSAAAIRAALVRATRGYAHSDLGRGQLDFDLALRHATPTTRTSGAAALGSTGAIPLVATSGAPRVAFRVDAGPRLASVPVVSGTARSTWSSFGYANGTHRLTAVDCSEFGECAAQGATTTFTVANAAPTLDSPPRGATVSGRFTASGTGPGGVLRLLVDGREAAVDRTAPYSFTLNAGAWRDADHRLAVQTCAAGQARCDGPRSAVTTVTFDSLHPAVTGLSRTRISPNGDGSGDTARVTFTLPERQDVTVETRDAAGTLRSRAHLGVLAAGRHHWTWRGHGSTGRRLPDGRYRLALVTARTAQGVTRHGLSVRSAAIDTVAPRLRSVRGNRARLYPARDGYRDAFRPAATLPDAGSLTLTVRDSAGHRVRTLRAGPRHGSRAAATWTGRTASGRVVRAGRYRWTFTVADSAGNRTTSRPYRLTVSAQRLRTVVRTLERPAHTADVGGTARCATRRGSAWSGGLHLVNRCRQGAGDVSYAAYVFTVPKAHRFLRLRLSAYGYAGRTSELSAYYERTDGGLEIPGAVRVPRTRARWYPVSTVPAASHVMHRRVRVTLILSDRYRGANDVDIRSVRLRVTLRTLV
ncbi:Serine protease, subtilisin family [Jatrophihabitans endophyticus]|uniref:Serine protease, subtilisin family n=1 Tax=Jatrophihabitans endophyticus TaxID=1206085 RepID=A0A1M5SVZ0_9ACTN|nr:S8 family serine peptidase [Jatrophihabitans endophyticus]SHH42731.1 Serine protease, subtilisin family [Jatrophihabitans endophyticus]